VLLRAGLSNSAASMGGGSYGAVPLERVIMSPQSIDHFPMRARQAAPSRCCAYSAFLSLGMRMTINQLSLETVAMPGPWVADAVSLLAAERAKGLASLAEK